MAQRFWNRVEKTNGCWQWTGSTDTNGYGQLRIPGPRSSHKKVRTSRYSWVLHYGPIPNGMLVLHTCDNRRCVRPDHLWLGTQADNMADMSNKGRHPYHHRQTCKQGHPFTEENTYRYGPDRKWRGCRICRAEAVRKYDHEHIG